MFVFRRIRALVRLSLPLTLGIALLSQPINAAPVNPILPASVQNALKASKIAPESLSVATLPMTGSGNTTLFNTDVAVNPASTMKLITTYAALELLGPQYQWETTFYTDGNLRNGTLQGNLYLKGSGDPKLNMEKLWLLLRDLRANGVQTIRGDLVLDRSYLRLPAQPIFNDDGQDANKPFLVEPDTLMVNLKTLRLILRAEGGQTDILVEPPLQNIHIDNQLKTVKAKNCARWPDVQLTPTTQADGSVVVTAQGSLAEGCSMQTYIALLDHPAYASAIIRSLWQELGGRIEGSTREAPVPGNARVLVKAVSPDVAEIIRDINKYSNNTMARQLFLAIGAKNRIATDPDDAFAAQRTIHEWLTRKGIANNQLVMENGSGLSRNERVSAREMAQILSAAYHSPYAAEFMASLPLIGVDGTMHKRLRHSAVAGQGHIKTGTLNNVRAIGGFVKDRTGDDWVVVAILNDPRPWGASSILDQVLIEVYQQRPSLPASAPVRSKPSKSK